MTIFVSLQMLGLGRGRRCIGSRRTTRAACAPTSLRGDPRRTRRPDDRRRPGRQREHRGVRPAPEIVAAVREHGGWLHVDGAFGLWAAASPSLRTGSPAWTCADSWTTDAHKWLNVPYDSGLVFVRDAGPTTRR